MLALEPQERRRPGRPARQLKTLAGVILDAILRKRAEARAVRWPCAKYRGPGGIVRFAEEVLGQRVWSRQRELLLAIQEREKVAVKSGHRVSKSNSLAVSILWFFCSFEDARVAMTAPTSKQVEQVLYHEIRRLFARSGTCATCREAGIEVPCEHSAVITGSVGKLARTGIRCGSRQIFGYSVKKVGALQGIAGRNLYLVIDEAAEIDEDIYEGLEGNRAASSKMVLTGNPTQLVGTFFDAYHEKRQFWHTLSISSLESPNCTGEMQIPGLATPAWCAERAAEWGLDSPIYKVRVLGEFASLTESRPFSPQAVADSQAAHKTQEARGRLHLGIDPAGATTTGDETVIAVRRGFKIIELHCMRGYDELEIVDETVAILAKHRKPVELPVVNVDADGPVGKAVCTAFDLHLSKNPGSYQLWRVRGSSNAPRDPRSFAKYRDEAFHNFSQWLAQGGALPPDQKLREELVHMEWTTNSKGQAKMIDKDRLRKLISRSPDRADACVLSTWQAPNTAFDAEQTPKVVLDYYSADRLMAPWDRPRPESEIPTRDYRGDLTGAERSWRD